MDCIKCNSQIPEGRIQILPNTKTCVNCSSTGQWYARAVITGKTTYSEVEVIKDTNAIKEMRRYDSKSRTGFGSSLYRVRK